MTDTTVVESKIDRELAKRVALEGAVGRTQSDTLLIHGLREQIRKNPTNALEIMSGSEPPPKDIAIKFADSQIGSGIFNTDPITGLRNRTGRPAHESNLFNRAKTAMDGLYNFVEKGIRNPQMYSDVLSLLVSDPGFKIALEEVNGSTLTPAILQSWITNPNIIPSGVRNVIESLLDNPNFKSKVKEQLRDKLDITKPISQKSEVLKGENQL